MYRNRVTTWKCLLTVWFRKLLLHHTEIQSCVLERFGLTFISQEKVLCYMVASSPHRWVIKFCPSIYRDPWLAWYYVCLCVCIRVVPLMLVFFSSNFHSSMKSTIYYFQISWPGGGGFAWLFISQPPQESQLGHKLCKKVSS